MCSDVEFLEMVVIFKNIMNIVAICVPVLLIIMMSFDVIKAVVSSNQEDISKRLKQIPSRIFAAVLVFLVPYIMEFALQVISFDVSYASCMVDIDEEKIDQMYIDRADSSVMLVEQSLNSYDLSVAKSYVRDVRDEELKDQFDERLKAVEEIIDASNNKDYVYFPVSPGGNYGEFPYYNQCDGSWSTSSINGYSSICNSGCGYTSLAMISSYLNDTTITPDQVATKLGYASALPDSKLTDTQTFQSKLGIKPKELYSIDNTDSIDPKEKQNAIESALRKGEPIILYVPGHYIVLTGISDDLISVHDPGASSKNGQYTYSELYNTYWNRKSKCTSSGGDNCGLKYAVSFTKY